MPDLRISYLNDRVSIQCAQKPDVTHNNTVKTANETNCRFSIASAKSRKPGGPRAPGGGGRGTGESITTGPLVCERKVVKVRNPLPINMDRVEGGGKEFRKFPKPGRQRLRLIHMTTAYTELNWRRLIPDSRPLQLLIQVTSRILRTKIQVTTYGRH